MILNDVKTASDKPISLFDNPYLMAFVPRDKSDIHIGEDTGTCFDLEALIRFLAPFFDLYASEEEQVITAIKAIIWDKDKQGKEGSVSNIDHDWRLELTSTPDAESPVLFEPPVSA